MTRAAHREDRLLTLEEYQQLADDDRYRDELARGRLVREPRPTPRHGALQLRLAQRLAEHARRTGSGQVLVEAGFIVAEDPPTVRGPDVSFYSRERIPGALPDRLTRTAPDLAAEILSPSNRAVEMLAKVMEYMDAGVRLVWLVDPASRSVTVHYSRTDIRILDAGEELDGGPVLPGFRLGLAELFAD